MLGSLAGKHILDVGWGTGRGVIDFVQKAGLAVGVDASLDTLHFITDKAKPFVKCLWFLPILSSRLPPHPLTL
jgi:ubiquinone/menaquinone biosynthesis C-methylase UbiE